MGSRWLTAAPGSVLGVSNARHGVAVVGRTHEIHERFYAISVERRLKHPGVMAISSAAREELFEPQRSP